MERLFFRSHKEERTEEKREELHIGVTGLGQGVGTTFVAAALAFYFRDLGKKVSFTECLCPKNAEKLLYDAVAMDKRFGHRNFYDIYQLISNGEVLRNKENYEEGIFWRIASPESCTKATALNEGQKGRLIASAKGEVCIFDLEADYTWDEFLLDMDVIIVVADPLPSKLTRNQERFKRLKKMELAGCSVVWIVNKMNPGVHRREVRSYLKTEKIFWLEMFPAENIYGAEYACSFPWQNTEIKRKMLEIFTKVSQYQGSLFPFSISKPVEI